MAKRPQFNANKKKQQPRRAPGISLAAVSAPREYKPPTQYGTVFILLEDKNKNTFEFKGGAWVAFGRTIAQCKVDCQVKELSQKVNQMTRYEIRAPLEA